MSAGPELTKIKTGNLTEQEKFDLPRSELPVPPQLLVDLLGALGGLLLVGRQRAPHLEADRLSVTHTNEIKSPLLTNGRKWPGRTERNAVHAAAARRTPNTPRRTDDTCCTTAFAAFAMEGKGRRANNFARLYFVPSSLLSSFQLVFFYSAAPPAGREQHRKRTGREVCLCTSARTAGPADQAALNRAPCISQRARAVQPTGFGWFCLCGFAPLRFVWSIRSGREI